MASRSSEEIEPVIFQPIVFGVKLETPLLSMRQRLEKFQQLIRSLILMGTKMREGMAIDTM